jgi:hypothetical protein
MLLRRGQAVSKKVKGLDPWVDCDNLEGDEILSSVAEESHKMPLAFLRHDWLGGDVSQPRLDPRARIREASHRSLQPP